MKKLTYSIIIILLGVLTIAFQGCSPAKTENSQRTVAFDSDWRFLKGNPADAQNPGFDDLLWRMLDLPHDWSIEDLPDQIKDSIIGPFSKASVGKMSTGYTIGGTGWYRKNFTLSKNDENKVVYLQFDGVYMNSDVYVNGKLVGNHPNGYTSFYYDITSFLNPAGQPNTVAVCVKNEGKNSRWYSGSGIYRHTWLTVVNPVHVGVWGVHAETPSVDENSAQVNVSTNLVNSGKEGKPVTVKVEILDPSGKVVGNAEGNITIQPDAVNKIEQKIQVNKPDLWSIDSPKLYAAKVSVLDNGKESDVQQISFGIRSIRFDAQTGFTLNGKSIEMKGGCYHHDNGPLGSAAIDRAEERKIEIFKKAGLNAIRCSHNPPSPYLLEACDRLGMLVIDEITDMWEKPKNENDYSLYFKEWWQKDIQSMLLRDRNHPSVIMWSIGNEIPEAADTSGLRIAKKLAAEVRKFDTSRAVTQALVGFWSPKPGKSDTDKMASLMNELDVAGYNYAFNKYEEHHALYPNRIMYASEFMPLYALDNWKMVEKLPYVIGNFAWVVMDYLGEAGVGLSRLVPDVPEKPGQRRGGGMGSFFNRDSWPIFNDYQGDIDLIGNMKPRYYHQLVVWRQSPVEMMVHRPIPAGMKEIVSPWGWPDELKSWSWAGHEKEKMQVHVYTRSKLVKLELNGKVIGEQAVDGENAITATFEVPYEAGTLTARCFDNGKETASQTLKTVGAPSALRLIVDRATIKASRNDLAYVNAEVVDAEGNVIPYADDVTIQFEISGPGEIAGVASGSPTEMSSFKQPQKKTFMGKCLAIVRPNGAHGKIILKAKAEGLKESAVEIITQ